MIEIQQLRPLLFGVAAQKLWMTTYASLQAPAPETTALHLSHTRAPITLSEGKNRKDADSRVFREGDAEVSRVQRALTNAPQAGLQEALEGLDAPEKHEGIAEAAGHTSPQPHRPSPSTLLGQSSSGDASAKGATSAPRMLGFGATHAPIETSVSMPLAHGSSLGVLSGSVKPFVGDANSQYRLLPDLWRLGTSTLVGREQPGDIEGSQTARLVRSLGLGSQLIRRMEGHVVPMLSSKRLRIGGVLGDTIDTSHETQGARTEGELEGLSVDRAIEGHLEGLFSGQPDRIFFDILARRRAARRKLVPIRLH